MTGCEVRVAFPGNEILWSKMSSCQVVRLSDCQVVRLSGCQVVRLSSCQVVKFDPWDMLNNFCFDVYAQKSMFIGENGNGFLGTTAAAHP